MTDTEFPRIRRSSPARLARAGWGAGRPIQDADTGTRKRAVEVEIAEVPAPERVAAMLGVPAGASVVCRSRRIAVDGRYVQLAMSYLPVELARGTAMTLAETGPGGIYARLAEAGHAPAVFHEELICRLPYPDEAEDLELVDGTPVVEITRDARQADGRCVEVNRMVLDASAYVLDFTFTS